jgi:hypothetical protein
MWRHGDNMPREYSCFLLAGDPEGNVPIRSPLLFGHFPKCIRCSVSIAEKSLQYSLGIS